jgi:hypothetical protein
MYRLMIVAFAIALISPSVHPQNAPNETVPHRTRVLSATASGLPSDEEIGELLNKASEYVDTYRQTFASARPSLAKAPTPGFYEKGVELSKQADGAIAALRKNGYSAYTLVGLISILDDMSLNGARASAATMIVALGEDRSNSKNHAVSDFQNLAQAEKNCYDISDLLLHPTLRLIAVEEQMLHALADQQKH